MALIGYARVSSVGQSLESQLNRLQHCDKIYQEKKSGSSNHLLEIKFAPIGWAIYFGCLDCEFRPDGILFFDCE